MNISLEVIQQAGKLFKQANNIALLPHEKPDGDALASCNALSQLAQSLGKNVETIIPTTQCSPCPFTPSPLQKAEHSFTPDLIISCDTANIERLYMPENFIDTPWINIDHHISNRLRATYNLVDSTASSTCEVIYFLLAHWGYKLSEDIANSLLFGLMSDTQTFRTSSTTIQTMQTAVELMKHGASISALSQLLISHDDPRIISLWGTILSRSQTDKHMVITAAYKHDFNNLESSDALTGFINTMSNITTVDIACLVYEQENGATKISFRSKQSDVNALAQHFGGGGHIRAAGATSKLSVEDTIKEIKNLI